MLAVLVVFLVTFGPSLLIVAVVQVMRSRDARLKRRLPLEGRALMAGPGGGLRRQIELEAEEVDSSIAVLFLVGPFFLATWAIYRLDLSTLRLGLFELMLLVAFFAVIAVLGRKVYAHSKTARTYREGLTAELHTGQVLNQLLAHECIVLHDIPAEGFNLDHVVIGPSAVFLIETKSRRKPEGAKGHRVVYDGERLKFADHVDAKPLNQATRYADWLRGYLRQSLDRPIVVKPVLALPGWFVDYTRDAHLGKVRVIAVAGKSTLFMTDNRHGPPIDATTRRMIAQALMLRCQPEAL